MFQMFMIYGVTVCFCGSVRGLSAQLMIQFQSGTRNRFQMHYFLLYKKSIRVVDLFIFDGVYDHYFLHFSCNGQCFGSTVQLFI